MLDAPCRGLDPVVRDDLVHGVLERAGDEQWSVLISSHDLDEVERLVDSVAFLDSGRIVLSEPMTTLQGRFRQVEVTLAGQGPAPDHESSWIGVTAAGRVVRFVDTRYEGAASDERTSARFPGSRVEMQPMSLRQIFVALVRHGRGQMQETSARAEREVRNLIARAIASGVLQPVK